MLGVILHNEGCDVEFVFDTVTKVAEICMNFVNQCASISQKDKA